MLYMSGSRKSTMQKFLQVTMVEHNIHASPAIDTHFVLWTAHNIHHHGWHNNNNNKFGWQEQAEPRRVFARNTKTSREPDRFSLQPKATAIRKTSNNT